VRPVLRTAAGVPVRSNRSWQSVRCQQATPTRSSCPAEPPCAGAGSTSPQGRCGRLRTPHCRRPKPEMAPQAPDPIDPSR
jgi:hypothetical protein